MGRGGGVEVVCTSCGPVVLDPVLAEIHANDRDGFALYVFVCPSCGALESGGDRRRLGELAAAGARRFELRTTGAPPLTTDDLLDLVAWLGREPDWPVADESR